MDPASAELTGKAIMVVEDEYLIALNIELSLADWGAGVLGPYSRVEDALDALETGPRPDGALLDINVRGKAVFPLAERLAALGVPFVFSTGYDDLAIPPDFAHVGRFEKPVDPAVLAGALVALFQDSPGVA